ncbi:hypothetical protein N9933_01065 [bacterium]|nr:hypothetical protein [bacterium]
MIKVEGMTRKEICDHYGLTKKEMAPILEHKKIANVRKGSGEATVVVVIDEDVVLPTSLDPTPLPLEKPMPSDPVLVDEIPTEELEVPEVIVPENIPTVDVSANNPTTDQNTDPVITKPTW